MAPNRHLVGLLLGMEEDWPRAFEEITRRVGVFKHAGDRARHRHRARPHLAVQSSRPGPARVGHRPAGVLVLPPARMAEEGRADGRRVPAELARSPFSRWRSTPPTAR